MRGSQTPDYYRIFGLSPSATAAEVKARYRLLSKQHHPDKGGNQADMARINQAYTVLADTFKRNIYDAERRRHLQTMATQTPRRSAVVPSDRQPAPRNATRFRTGPPAKRRTAWWPKIAFGFGSLVIVAGILLHLPIAEAVNTATDADTTVAKTLDVTYPPETTPSTHLVTNPTTPNTTPATGTTAPTVGTEGQTNADATQADPNKQKLRQLCSLASKNRLYNTEQVQMLCKPTRTQE